MLCEAVQRCGTPLVCSGVISGDAAYTAGSPAACQSPQEHGLVCRGAVHFDYVSGLGVQKSAAVLSSANLADLLWRKCNLNLDPEAGGRTPTLSPEKQMMRLRMLAPLITVNSAQVSRLPSAPALLCCPLMLPSGVAL